MRQSNNRTGFLFVLLAFKLSALFPCAALAQALFVVGEAVLPAVNTPAPPTPTAFTTITFDSPFDVGVVPNVFTMTTEEGDDPCTIRIRNVTNTGFDATCLEPINEDRDHPGMTFEYVAIIDGGVTVPLVGGGDVELRSACVNTSAQQYGNDCAGCSGAESYSSVTFAPAFASVPAVITQVQSTNNLVAGEPKFIDVAFDTGSLTASGFRVAIESMEAGVGPISNNERICYLAAEQGGCQELDFSSFDGPASVDFQALTGGTNVDGHGNGCTSGEGATFAAGCFSSTPIALAKQLSRNGGDGGFLRRCSVSAGEIILTYDEDRVFNTERNHLDEQTSVFAFGSTFTTPVTLSKTTISRLGRRAIFEWETSAETFHLGFNLWGEVDNQWVQLNRRMIPGRGMDTDSVAQYRKRLKLSRQQNNQISRFAISSIDTSGYEEFYGPFVAGQDYGESSPADPIDWAQARASFNQKMHDEGYVKVKESWRKVSTKVKHKLDRRELGLGEAFIELSTDGTGIHRVSADTILATDQSWAGIPLERVALTLNGQPVPRHIISEDRVFDAGDTVFFNAKVPSKEHSIYLASYHYQLRRDSSKVLEATIFNGPANDEALSLSDQGLIWQTLTEKRSHSTVITIGDPWYDSQLLTTGSPVSKVYPFDFSHVIDQSKPGALRVTLMGGIDLPGDVNDHHVQIRVNQTLLAEESFDGLTSREIQVEIPPNALKQTDNTLTITLPGDTGLFADLVLIDEVELSAQAVLSGKDKYAFQGIGAADTYEVSLQSNGGDAQVFAFTAAGDLSVIEFERTESGALRFAQLPGRLNEFNYAVGAGDSWLKPSTIREVQGRDLHADATDFLIVAHPAFTGPDLQDYVTLKTEQGFVPRVVDWLEVVETYGYGNNTPDALDALMRRLTEQYEVDHLMLVGGHTFDYLGITPEDVINYIPAYYRRVGIVEFAPTDTPFADADDDGLPDLAVGRWPVRGLDDLSYIVQKTKDWHSNRVSENYQDALLIAQPNDSRNLNFAGQMESRVASILNGSVEFDNIERVYLQTLIDQDDDNPVALAREIISGAINGGTDLVSFAGHASTSAWGFQSIVDTQLIKDLENVGQPAIVMPLACYTTNYESPTTDTLAHQWLFAGENGAVAIHGASVLGEYRENAIFAQRYLNQAGSAQTIGEAIMQAKQNMAPWNSMVNNWTLLGDPALPLR